MNSPIRAALMLSLLSGLALSGCAPTIMAGIATGGVVMAQERSVGNAIDDAGMQLDLRQRMLAASPEDFDRIDLEVVEGRVLMTGRVGTQETRIEASRLAWTTPGINDVINEVEISDRSVGLIRPRDTWISTQLRARLIGDTDVRVVNYHIETLDGTIYLFGIAQDEIELNRVAEHARAIRGVERVVSHMRLKNDPFALPARGA